MRWTETTAKVLCAACGAAIVLLGAAGASVLLEAKGILRLPSLPDPWGGIALWTLLALSLLFALDKGIPRESPWENRLLWMRRALFVAALATVLLVSGFGGR